MRTRVADINIWRNLPSNHAPVASQLWHRDQPDDHLVLKMFVYLEDVTDGRRPVLLRQGHARQGRPQVEAAPARCTTGTTCAPTTTTCTARSPRRVGRASPVRPAPSLLADTIGWHKGGQATTTPRLLFHVLYASRAATDNRLLGAPKGLDLSSATPDLAFDKRTAG